jgi:Ca-activated chloride channel homolog
MTFTDFLSLYFAHPWFLLLLLPLPLLAWLKGRRGSPPAFLYSSVKLVEGLTRARRSHAGAFLAALRWLALALFIVALAQPRLMKSETTVKASGVDIAVALDMSGSMVSEDFVVKGQRVNRFNMARSVLKNFIDERPSDRIGLIVFATQAFIATPLTLDHDFLQENLDRLEIGAINQNSTAIGDALSTAVNRLRDLKSKSKIVILMTDGQNNSGKIQPLMAADAARALGIKVYTIGIGEQGEAPMPVGRNPYTGETVYQNVPVDVDEDTLQKIADDTGGKYYRADNAEKFKQIYADIDQLEKTEAVINKYAEFQELFPCFVWSGLAVLLAELVLGQTIFRRLP